MKTKMQKDLEAKYPGIGIYYANGYECFVGHTLSIEDIKPSQRWIGSSGTIVEVIETRTWKNPAGGPDEPYVRYRQSDGSEVSKPLFTFQIMYKLINVATKAECEFMNGIGG